jgi:hypothetical protein
MLLAFVHCIILRRLDRVLILWSVTFLFVIEVCHWKLFIQKDIIKMAPCRVNPNKKQAKPNVWNTSNDQVGEDTIYLDRMRRTVSNFPSQATVDNVRKQAWALFLECLDDGEMQHIQIPTLVYSIIMQERFEAAKATTKEYTLPVAISKNQPSPYSNLDNSDDGPSSPKKTDATKLKIDKSLQKFYWGIASSWTSSLWI